MKLSKYQRQQITTLKWKLKPYVVFIVLMLCTSTICLFNYSNPIVTRHFRYFNRPMYFLGCNPQGWKSYVRPEYYYLFNGLVQDYGWEELPAEFYQYAHHEREIKWQKLIELRPTVILFCENNVEWYPKLPIDRLRAYGTKIAAFSDDLHMYNRYSAQQLLSILRNTDTLVGTYAYMMAEFFSPVMVAEELPKLLWIPHSACPSFTARDFNTDPIEKIFLSGATDEASYPIRHWLTDTFAEKHPQVMTVLRHPGYQKHPANQSTIYAQTVRAHMASITSTCIYRRMVAKTFEIPATGSLLLLNLDLEPLLANMGMYPFEHYLGYLNDDPEWAIWWTMDPANREKVNEIRKKGRDHVIKYHKTSDRAAAINRYFQYETDTYPFEPLSTEHPCPMTGFSGYLQGCINAYNRIVPKHKYHQKKLDQYILID